MDVAPEGVKFEAEDDVGSTADSNEPAVDGNPWRAVSADGSRVFFTGGEEEAQHLLGQLYVRENPMSPVEGCAGAWGRVYGGGVGIAEECA